MDGIYCVSIKGVEDGDTSLDSDAGQLLRCLVFTDKTSRVLKGPCTRWLDSVTYRTFSLSCETWNKDGDELETRQRFLVTR